MHPVASTRGSILIIKQPLQGEFAVHKNKSLAFIMFTSILQLQKKKSLQQLIYFLRCFSERKLFQYKTQRLCSQKTTYGT